ncbi:MAG: hypothetical protein R6W90_07300 [Ignavibacteriaceae bacterium]
MDQKLLKHIELLKTNHQVFLNYLKAKFPLFHNSNFFFRDFQYGLKRFLEKKDILVSYAEAEKIAVKLGEYFENEGIFVPVNKLGWKLNYPEFVTTQPGDPL